MMLYEEKVVPWYMLAVLAFAMCLCVGVALYAAFAESEEDWLPAVIITSVVTALLLFVTAAFRYYFVRVTEDRVLSFGFAWFHHTVPQRDVDHLEAVDINVMQWGGCGYRLNLNCSGGTAYVLGDGPGLHLRYGESGKKSISFNCKSPDTVMQLMTSNGPISSRLGP